MSESPISHVPPPPPRRQPAKVGEAPTQLASFMVANIVMLVIVCAASILLLLFGDFDGKEIRTISTLVLFGLFTLFAAIDSRRDKPERYVTISQVGHIYMLGMGLVLIWGSLLDFGFFDEFSIFIKTLVIVGLVKLGVVVIQRVSDEMQSSQPQLSTAARFCAGAVGLTVFLYTLPIGTDYFINFGEWYWKLSVAVLLFAGLAISVTALLSYYLNNSTTKSGRRAQPRRDEPIRVISRVDRRDETGNGGEGNDRTPQKSHAAPFDLGNEMRTGHEQPPAASQQPQAPRYAPHVQAADTPAGPPSYAAPVAGYQPWPVFPDGRPLPATQNGRPDFAVLQYIVSVHAEAERQWFGGGNTQQNQ